MNVTIGLVGIGALLLLLVLRVPIAISLILVSLFGVAALVGFEPAIGMLASAPYDFAASWTLSAIPMFLMMGFISFRTGLTDGLFQAGKAIFSRIPGGLAISAVFACSGFAAVCGSSIATAAAMGRIAIPEMVRSGYSANFAGGAIAAGGTIGALIPPSILMIIYGVLAQTSVNKVFMGGVFAGLLTAVSYVVVVAVVAYFRPDVIPRSQKGEQVSAREAIAGIWPVLVLAVLLFGGLFSGFFTATETGAMGAAGALLISAAQRKLSLEALRLSFLETLSASAAMFVIAVGAAMFTRFLGLSGAGRLITDIFAAWDLSYVALMLLIVLVYLLLGMFMEPLGAMMITLPIFLPILQANDLNLVWFGVLLIKLLEIGMITPPFGMNAFVIRSVAQKYVTLGGVFRGITAFLLADAFVIAFIIAVPAAVMWLPNTLN